MSKLKFIVCRGLSGSGKSYWAKEKADELENCVVITKDDIREQMGAIVGDNERRVKESKVIEKRNELIIDALEKGMNIISADTNLNSKANHIENMKALVFRKYRDLYDFTIEDSFLKVPIETCIERCASRPQGKEFWTKVIMKQKSENLRPIQIYEDVTYYNSTLPLAIIVDLDNTLTFKGERSAYADDCSGDRPNIPVTEIVKMYCERSDVTVICLSGRKESARESTENWLSSYGIKYNMLYMRAQDDNRRDSIMKREIYQEKIKGKYLIHLVLDDRFQVCDELWREEGLPLLQFGNSNF